MGHLSLTSFPSLGTERERVRWHQKPLRSKAYVETTGIYGLKNRRFVDQKPSESLRVEATRTWGDRIFVVPLLRKGFPHLNKDTVADGLLWGINCSMDCFVQQIIQVKQLVSVIVANEVYRNEGLQWPQSQIFAPTVRRILNDPEHIKEMMEAHDTWHGHI